MRIALVWCALWLLLPACAGRKIEEPKPKEAPPPAEGEDLLAKVEKELKLHQQYAHVMSERLYALAMRQRDVGELGPALDSVKEALIYEPTSEKALRLRDELLYSVGDRAASARTILDDHWAAYQARKQEQRVAVKVWLERAQKAAEAGDLEAANRAYERALFILRSR
ncbi:MAG: hypothetical protein ACYSX0_08120 [Planctomycetota bacterium]|jgi:tetratricopeptide (TPR) repeat protein